MAYGSSAKFLNMVAILEAGHSLITSRAFIALKDWELMVEVVSNLMSNGPCLRNVKPRSALSIWVEFIPRSIWEGRNIGCW